jgi:predicted membrane-bound dolichyl-phosphate-mannose-protein mannosyltransferase
MQVQANFLLLQTAAGLLNSKKEHGEISVLTSRKEESLQLTVLAAATLTATFSGLAAAKLVVIVDIQVAFFLCTLLTSLLATTLLIALRVTSW